MKKKTENKYVNIISQSQKWFWIIVIIMLMKSKQPFSIERGI